MESGADKFDEIIISDAHGYKTPSLNRTNRYRDSMEHQAPAIPAHRCTPTLNSLKTRFVYNANRFIVFHLFEIRKKWFLFLLSNLQ